MKRPPVHYAESPEGKIAYQVVGDGPIDLVFHPTGGWNLDIIWEHPPLERYLRRLASFSRLILFNPRGSGLSDPIPLGAPPTLEEWAMDHRWVLDAAGSARAAFLTVGDIGPFVLLFAATFPERTLALGLINCYASLLRRDDYPWGFPPEVLDRLNAAAVSTWGTGGLLRFLAPEVADDEPVREWYARLERGTSTPSFLEIFRRTLSTVDVRGILPSINTPTLVVSHAGNPYIRLGHGRYLTEHIPSARYVERPGFFGLPWVHDVEGTLDEVQTFLTGTKGMPDLDDRVLATILFTDIVGSTERAAEIRDKPWRELLDEHDSLTRREIERFRGRAVKTTGDGVLATFDGPARAIRCAIDLRESARALGLEIYTGLHTGEIEVRGDDVSGIAVNIAARVMAEAGAGEVLVSGSVPPLVAGSGIEFDDRGVREFKGVPGEWRLFAVKD